MGCDLCGGSGWILYEDSQGRSIARECVCRGIEISKARLEASGISEALREKTLDNYDDRNIKTLCVAKDKAKDYIASFEKIEHKTENSMLFLGQVGAGKSHLSLAIANELLEKKSVSVVYMPYSETMVRLGQLEFRDKYAYDAEMHRYTHTRLLIIDDLYKGTTTDRDKARMFQIVNQRYLSKMPFICSTEKTHLELVDIDEGTGSRLIEQARGHSILFEGKELNWRLRKKV